MAAPRIFVSSTFYDQRHVRADLERFISELGYEPILHERGGVTYGSKEELEQYCYEEIKACDILISIVGGKFGSKSSSNEGSISQEEVRTALKLGRPVYTFVEKQVLAEYRTWQLNKENKDVKYASVDDARIFTFISEIYALGSNNIVEAFESTDEISIFLKRQWSGLFQRYLRDSSILDKAKSIEKLEGTVATLERLVNLLAEGQEKSRSDIVSDILLFEHPLFLKIKDSLELTFRVAFFNFDELDNLLKSFRFRDYPNRHKDYENYFEWERYPLGRPSQERSGPDQIMIKKTLFDSDGKLRPIRASEFKEDDFLFYELPF